VYLWPSFALAAYMIAGASVPVLMILIFRR
jgi:hypothetical protein